MSSHFPHSNPRVKNLLKDDLTRAFGLLASSILMGSWVRNFMKLRLGGTATYLKNKIEYDPLSRMSKQSEPLSLLHMVTTNCTIKNDKAINLAFSTYPVK